jgi:voltage-gated sodium channel
VVRFAQAVVASPYFHNTIIVLILVSGIISGIETYLVDTQERDMEDLLLWVQNVILGIFVVEILVKMLAFGREPWRYFAVGWNVFDFLIVTVCLLPFEAQFATVFRMARLVRLLRLVTILPRLQLLVGALLRSIPSLGYIGILLGLHFYMYAVTGTFLFRANDPLRFGTLHESFLTLFQVLTLEGWNDVLHTQYLGSDATYDDSWRAATEGFRVSRPQPLVASAYFVSFIMLGTMIMLNLFTGVIIASMEEAANDTAQTERVTHLKERGFLTLRDELALVHNQLAEITGTIEALQRRTGHVLLDEVHEKSEVAG